MDGDPSQMRVGDAQRSEALEMLSQHYANGLLDLTEFEERTGAAAVAKVRDDLDKLFQDLPPLNRAAEDPRAHAPGAITNAELEAEKELDNLLERGKKVQVADSVFWTLAFVFCILGVVAFDFDYFWVGFPIAFIASLVIRWLYRIDDEDEDLIEELMEDQRETSLKERTARLRQAAKRRKELER